VGQPDGSGVAANVGQLRIVAVQGARVFVDDVEVGDIGDEPYSREVSVGSHRVRLEADGYEVWESDVQVAEGSNAPLQPRLEKESRGGGGRHKSRGKSSPKPQPATSSAAPATTKAPPPEDPKPKSDDVFMKESKEKPANGIFLPVGQAP